MSKQDKNLTGHVLGTFDKFFDPRGEFILAEANFFGGEPPAIYCLQIADEAAVGVLAYNSGERVEIVGRPFGEVERNGFAGRIPVLRPVKLRAKSPSCEAQRPPASNVVSLQKGATNE